MEDWPKAEPFEARGFTRSRQVHICPCMLTGLSAGARKAIRDEAHGRLPRYYWRHAGTCLPAADHSFLFRKDGRVALFVTCPYANEGDRRMEAMRAFCARHGLAIVSSKPSIYGFGTIQVEITMPTSDTGQGVLAATSDSEP